LAGRLDHLPRLLADGIYRDQIDWPYLALQFCPGQPIREVYQILKPENKVSLAHALGRMLRIAHDTPLTNLVTFTPQPEAWQKHMEERRNLCLDEARRQGMLPENVLAEVALFLASVAPLISADSSLNLLHADLTEDHLLLVEQDNEWQISALIDWSDAEVGAPAYEWVVLWFGACNRDPAMFREVLRAYDPALRFDDAFQCQMMAYTFLHRFGAGIIADTLRRVGQPSIYTLAELQNWLWSGLFT
jgi:aminoglycoside phosphotransferase (APT) family kinase protein